MRLVDLPAHREFAPETGRSGLGLAIAKQIAKAHGGTISIGDSTLGGAIFSVRLPISCGNNGRHKP
jgi:signal transduction histidine kinase